MLLLFKGEKDCLSYFNFTQNYIFTFYGETRLRVFHLNSNNSGSFFITGESHLLSAEVCDLDESVLDRPRVLALDLCEQIINEFCSHSSIGRRLKSLSHILTFPTFELIAAIYRPSKGLSSPLQVGALPPHTPLLRHSLLSSPPSILKPFRQE